ncbi:hypothetical protein [Staphylococcus aureus]|uniref:hypothetical protein n=1 Tax=Staphylococcus aureus TaxID=1280 RepID=UPI00119ED2D1|nr:hypothetical protein [Staphylococcus aureus]
MVEDGEFDGEVDGYNGFVEEDEDDKVLYLEIGIGYSRGEFVKDGFEGMRGKNENGVYMRMNKKGYGIGN